MALTNCGGKLTGYSSQGGRKYMEDYFTVVYFSPKNKKTVYAFFGIFDGHGGSEAAEFANTHLLDSIINQKLFWSDCDSEVLRAIRQGYISTHCSMWKQQESWPKTASGLPSTAGTTATIAFIRGGKIYIGHVGDSGIVLGFDDENDNENVWKAKQLTQDHKPDSPAERARIISSGGKVINKSGVPRVVWNRPRIGHKGPVRRSTPFDEIPFLAVARSLGDLWSYNPTLNKFVVSPDPDVRVLKIDKTFRCLVFGTDGLWNVISASESVSLVQEAHNNSEQEGELSDEENKDWQNPSKYLLGKALDRWNLRKMRADNTSVVTFIFNEEFLDTISDEFRSDCTINSFDIQSDSDIGYNTLNIQRIDDELHVNSFEDPPEFYSRNKDSNNESLLMDDIEKNSYSDLSSPMVEEDTNTIVERFDTSPSTNEFDQICHSSENPILDNSSSNYIFDSSSPSKTIYDQNMEESSDDTSYSSDSSSFAESYNTLLLTNLQSESSSDSCSNDNSNIVDETNRHIYKSLNETGLAGHDYIYQHSPNTSNEQQQHQYQQACMLGEGGYSLTKLETRCEQKLRNTSTSFLLKNINNSKIDNLITFQAPQALSINDNEDLYNFVQFNNKSNSTKNIQPNKCNTNNTEDYGTISSICNYKTYSGISNSEKKKISKLDNAYKNNEITSKIHESESSNQILNCEIFHSSSSVNKKLNRKRKTSEVRYDDFNKKLRSSTSSCFPDKQNENNLSTIEQKPINYTKRTLRSRNSLTKEITKTTISKKSQPPQMQLKRSILAKEFFKSLKSPTTLCKLRTRQQHQQFTIWAKSKRSTLNSSAALCSNSNLNKTNNNLSSIGNNSNKNKNCNSSSSGSSSSSSNSSGSSSSNNKIHLRALSSTSPPKTRSSSSSISAKRNNSQCLVGKNVVQTRNRVQKR